MVAITQTISPKCPLQSYFSCRSLIQKKRWDCNDQSRIEAIPAVRGIAMKKNVMACEKHVDFDVLVNHNFFHETMLRLIHKA